MYRREIKITAQAATAQAGKAAKLVTLVYLLCQLGLSVVRALSNFLPTSSGTGHNISDSLVADARNKAIVFLILLVITIAGQLLQVGYARISLQIHRREPVPMDSLLEGFQIPGRVIGLELLRELLMFVWCGAMLLPVAFYLFDSDILGGDGFQIKWTFFLVLTIVVAIIVAYRYWGATYILLDHPDYTVRECIRAATEMTRGHRMELFLLELSLIPWHLLCMLTAGILYIWKMPYIAAVYAGAYEELNQQYQKKKERARELRRQFPTRQHPPEQM